MADASQPLPSFEKVLETHRLEPLRRAVPATLQINVGKLCDLACHHCHVEAGPKRSERMERATVERALELLGASSEIDTVDLTGGAPELNENFRFFVTEARRMGRRVIDRCNLTVFFVSGQEETVDFLAQHEVEVIASLPCYTKENVEAQRGRGVFGKSIEALRWLNRVGYGRENSSRQLDLVYNPLGAFLPPPQTELERRYKNELRDLFGIEFHRLFTITNMPIKRFAHALAHSGKDAEYMSLLVNHFNASAVPRLMCHDLVSVGWDGALYDCDFNQMLDLPLGGRSRTLWDVKRLSDLTGERIATASHCFGCTAGAGSSCGGALA
jgi:radical SAM/Cys-rich protein